MNRCKLCGSENLKIVNNIKKYKLIRCFNCHIVFLSPQPRILDLKVNNLQKYESSQSIKSYFNMKDIIFNRAKKYSNILSNYKKTGYLLDVGCSFGFYLKVFNQCGYKTLGIDLSNKAVNYIDKTFHLNAIIGRFETYPFKEKSFDIVSMLDVFEHFSDPIRIVSKLRIILKKDGIVIIQVPNIDSLISRITGSKWYWLLLPQHLFLFSKYSLEFLLTQNKFKILHISTWDDNHEFVSNVLFLLGIKCQGKTKIFYRILIKLKLFLIPLSFLWNIFFLGGEILVYAKKEE